MSRFSIDLKHDTKHKKWKRLSVVTLSVEALDGDAYVAQYARDNQMNPDQIAYRIVEIDPTKIGSSPECFIRIVFQKESAATANRAS